MPAKTIEFPFYFGDTVYRVAYKSVPNYLDRICPVCNGNGQFISPSSGRIKDCPGVNGYMCVNGQMATTCTNCAAPVGGQITDIFLDEDFDTTMYEVDFGDCFCANQLSSNFEQVQEACEALNEGKKFV